jgi:hypothetical protein
MMLLGVCESLPKRRVCLVGVCISLLSVGVQVSSTEPTAKGNTLSQISYALDTLCTLYDVVVSINMLIAYELNITNLYHAVVINTCRCYVGIVLCLYL